MQNEYQKIQNSTSDKVQSCFFQRLKENIDNAKNSIDIKAYRNQWRSVAYSTNAFQEEMSLLQDEYTHFITKKLQEGLRLPCIQFSEPMGHIYGSLFGFLMPGIAIIASYLSLKKDLHNLFVCATREGLRQKLVEIATTDQDSKCACIVSNSPFSFPLHKFCVGIEKKEGHINIVILDGLPGFSMTDADIEALISQIPFSKKNIDVFFYDKKREFTGYGCAIFALQDAVSFLQNPCFFEHARQYSHLNSQGKTHEMTHLPPEFMIGTQSISHLTRYLETYPENGSKPLPSRKKNLCEYLHQNTVSNQHAEQNHYITRKMFKYMHYIVEFLKTLSNPEIEKLFQMTLLT